VKIESGTGATGTWIMRTALATLVAAIGALAAASGAAAQDTRPTITGSPVLGATLQSSSFGSGADYRWQRCYPVTHSCGDTLVADDPNWFLIPGANSRSYTLVEADVGTFVRVLARSAPVELAALQLDDFTPSTPFGPVIGPPTPMTSGGLTPIHGVQVLAEPAEGRVWVKFPGEDEYVLLTGLTALPVGTIVNVRHGRIRIVGATGPFGSTSSDQSIEFALGVFKLKQGDAADAAVIVRLVENLSCGKGKSDQAAAGSAGPRAVASARRRRRLWGSGRGRYKTRGRGGTGSVVGTTWVQKETCDRATWKVTEGEGIIVDPRGRKKDVELEAGEKLSIDL